MQHKFCPTFKTIFKKLFKKYKKDKDYAVGAVNNGMANLSGDKWPGLKTGLDVRKYRISLPTYKISKRKGLRYIYLYIQNKQMAIAIHIYKKGAYKQESQIKRETIANLKSILQQLGQDNCCDNQLL